MKLWLHGRIVRGRTLLWRSQVVSIVALSVMKGVRLIAKNPN